MALDDKFLRNTGTKTVTIVDMSRTGNGGLKTVEVDANTANRSHGGGGRTIPTNDPIKSVAQEGISAAQAYAQAAAAESAAQTKAADTQAPEWLTPRSTGGSGSGSGSTGTSGSGSGGGGSRRSSGGGGGGYTPTVTQPTTTVPTTQQTTPVTPTVDLSTVPNIYMWDNKEIDLNHDYSQDYEDARLRGDEAAMKLIEQYRNAKIAILNYLNQNPNGFAETDKSQGVDLANTAIQDAQYQQLIQQLENQRQEQIAAQNAQLAAANAQYDLQQKEATDARNAELRQQYIDSQLDLKALEEVLAANGISGGDINSALLDARTAYAQNYANAQDAYNRQMAEILTNRNSATNGIEQNVAAIRQTYGDRIADAYLQKANAKAQAEAQALEEIKARLGYK